jgi:hypothetical protein
MPEASREAGMSENGVGDPPDTDEGFVLWEGWMFGAVMFEPAAEHITLHPPANDNEGER